MILILVIYFQPMHLADLADPTSELSITRQHIYVENGEPEIDTESYNDLSEDQTRRIIDSLQQYTVNALLGCHDLVLSCCHEIARISVMECSL